MKVTLFTSNQIRHNYFINLLSINSSKLFVVQETNNKNSNIEGRYNSKIMKNYFANVSKAQHEIFKDFDPINKKGSVDLLKIDNNSVSNCSPEFLSKHLNSDIYIVFGSTFIKGWLADFLIKKKAINIHMGIAPYYRGTDCNFWALFDNNPHLVGATIHKLSKGLDNGSILYHAISNRKKNLFTYTMSTVKAAFYSVIEKINDETIFYMKPENQNKQEEIRYSKKNDFNEKIIEKFNNQKVNLNFRFNFNKLKEPYILK
tara:strand:+ start:9575 stop:10351 length:777 start_codon:yes stop_codon:yes gene_type:complete